VLAELDPRRQQLLLEAVGDGHQCLVSATHLGAFSADWRRDSQVVRMRNGALQPEGGKPLTDGLDSYESGPNVVDCPLGS